MAKKKAIDRRNAIRAILTDTLPYETPFYFTNERLFHAASNKFEGLPEIARLLLDPPHEFRSRPFSYQIHKGGGALRTISIPHPAIQLRLARFYGDFDGFIESLCARGTYSLRRPSRVASHYFESQFIDNEDISVTNEPDADPVSFYSQRKWASNYFSYRNYTHMYKFFLSDEFRQLEEQFSFLLQADIASCFDSIYSHSISWAVRGKEFSKENIEAHSFESIFDKLIREANWSETSGILIGPEFSRIFAEIIMQSVDKKVCEELRKAKLEVQVRRYIDDFLIFGKSEHDVLEAKRHIEATIRDYNLHLNESKAKLIARPLISSLTVARDEANAAVSDFFSVARAALTITEGETKHFPSAAGAKLVTRIRHIARTHGVSYSTLASPTLAVVARHLLRLERRCVAADSARIRKYAPTIIEEILKATRFIFAMDIRTATSHKVARIYYLSSLLAAELSVDNVAFEKSIVDGMRAAISAVKDIRIPGLEVINLIVASEAVCKRSKAISLEDLANALGVHGEWSEKIVERFNYFELTAGLYFSRKRPEFQKISALLGHEIEGRILRSGKDLKWKTDETMLFFDYISCPHIAESKKVKLLINLTKKIYGQTVGVNAATSQVRLLSSKLGFVAWDGKKHLYALLERKELQPAYQ